MDSENGLQIGDRLNKHLLHDAVEELCGRDSDLALVVQRWGTPPLWARRPGFATLFRIILEQQVTLASAEATYRRLQLAVGRVTARKVAGLSSSHLRRWGFTRQKAGYCLGLARLVVGGGLNLERIATADDATARAELLDVRGIGPWTADVYLLMALGRPDVWPDGDVALVSALRRVKRLRGQPSIDRVRRMASAWAPWRSVAARILWHAYLSERRQARTAADNR